MKNPTGDDRFSSLFTKPEFEMDESSESFRLRNPSLYQKPKPFQVIDFFYYFFKPKSCQN